MQPWSVITRTTRISRWGDPRVLQWQVVYDISYPSRRSRQADEGFRKYIYPCARDKHNVTYGPTVSGNASAGRQEICLQTWRKDGPHDKFSRHPTATTTTTTTITTTTTTTTRTSTGSSLRGLTVGNRFNGCGTAYRVYCRNDAQSFAGVFESLLQVSLSHHSLSKQFVFVQTIPG